MAFIFPGNVYLLNIFAFNVIGDGLRDALDPRYVNRSESMEKILEVKDLQVSFQTYAGDVQAVRGVNFDLIKEKH